jgi:DNA primase
MLYEQVEFPEAVRILAERNGIPLSRAGSDRSGSGEADRKARILETNTAAREYYRVMLSAPAGAGARKYLESRDLSSETLEFLSVGYAPDGWDHLRNHLTGKRFAPSELVQAGLASPRKDGSGEYDRFRNRIIFPIQDLYGKTIAFGGRAIPPVEEREPKYLNSPETPAYVKGEHLYGLNLAREAIRREGYAIVVEGYMDLAALVQAGFQQGVASLGTAFTQAQARLLGRYTRRVVVSYDGDAAGSKAAVRSLDLLLERGFEVRLVDLPEGMDPDDVIRQQGADAYSGMVRQAPEYIEWMVNRETRGRTMGTAREKIEAVNNVLPHIARMTNPIERVSWTGRLADALGIEDDLVLQELRAALKEARPDIRQRVHKDAVPELRQVERRLLAAELEGLRISGIVEVILSLEESGQTVDYPAVLEALGRMPKLEDQGVLTQIAFDDEPTGGMEEADACLKTIRRERLVRERKNVQEAIRKTQDRSTLDALLLQKMQLARQIDTLT